MRTKNVLVVVLYVFMAGIFSSGCLLKHPVLIGPNQEQSEKKVVLTPGVKSVFEKNKQIIYFDGKDQSQLTKTGLNHAPVLSPDGTLVLFTRKSSTEAMLPVEGDGFLDPEDALSDQIWLMDIATQTEKKLVDDLPWPEQYPNEGIKRLLPWVSRAQFSVDGKNVFFLVPVWVTSSALYVVPTDGGESKYLFASNYLKVIERGKYKGNLVINQHRYFFSGGSYDWYYIYSPDGKELQVLSDDSKAIDWDWLYFESTENDGA